MAMSSSSSKRARSFLDLPLETQKQIVASVSRKDLFTLQTTSSLLHGLASAQLYRNLDFNIISAETEDGGNPASRAADALQTILASEYEYGQHIKSFRIGAVADRNLIPQHSRHHNPFDDQLTMTRLLWDSKADTSKFLNTSLLLMARKASILETFKWDAPIELSSAVYEALHKITSLRHLLIRLDVSPAPKIVQRSSSHHQGPIGGPPPGPFPPAPIGITTVPPYMSGLDSNISKRRKIGGSKFWAKRRAFSGFKYLSTLAVVGIANLECISEVAECIKASSATLKSLTLTLSSELARKSRKPATAAAAAAMDDDVSDTELDDEDFMDHPPPPASGGPQPASEADIREEKLAQENILATVFDLQSVAQVGKKLEKKLSLTGSKSLEEEDSKTVHDRFIVIMKSLQDVPLNTAVDAASRNEQIKLIRNFLDLYQKSQLGTSKKATTSSNKDAKLEKMIKQQKELVFAAEQKQLLATKKQLHTLNAKASSFKPSGLSNEINGLMENLPIMGDDITELMSPYDIASGKSSSYEFPSGTSGYYSGASSSLEIPPPPPPNKGTNGDFPPYLPSPYQYSPHNPPPIQYSTYSHSHHSSNHSVSGTQTPTLSSMYPSYANGYTGPMYSPPMGMPYSNKSTSSLSKHAKPSKAKKHAPKSTEAPKPASFPSSDESEADTQAKIPTSKDPVFSSKIDDQPVESMDVDMDHPDVEFSEPGEEQEFVPDVDETDIQAPRKRFKVRDMDAVPPLTPSSSSPTVAAEGAPPAPPSISAADAMQDYIRVTHGLQLETLRLHWIPLKASIIGRALDLRVLQRITLLEVGPQDTFWTMLTQLTNVNNEITFKSIHTDHVSKAFVKFLGTFHGLEELFMHERHAKSSDNDSEQLVDVAGLRKTALNSHVSTLKRLMMRNERDDSWDVDTKTLQFLALKTKSLTELACSMRMQTYHILIQMFAGFTNLYALHLIKLGSTERNTMLQIESMNFAVDSLSHCPGVKLRYLALADQVNSLESRPDHFRKHLKMVMEHQRDKKGKGKAVDIFHVNPVGDAVDDASDRELDDVLAEVAAGEKKLRFSTRFDDVKDVRIFAKEIRTGRT